ncbi:MAG: RNA chaperone Hfq [Acidobacteria bacterium]|nr:RNA chaperone Hfq [Acidobacteriota bacterium]
MVNRKLIRPSLADVSTTAAKYAQTQGRKRVPPDQTFAENFYYVKQMNNRTPMIVHLNNGEKLQGIIEWYDRDCIKLNRDNAPNLLLYKSSILYMYKEEEETASYGGNEASLRRRPRRKKTESLER